MGFEGPLREWGNALSWFCRAYAYPLLLLLFVFLLVLGMAITTLAGSGFWARLRRFMGILVPVICLVFLISAGILSRLEVLQLFKFPLWIISAVGFAIGAGLVEFYRLFQDMDQDLPMALANMLLATITVLSVMFFVLPDLQITVWIMGPLLLGTVLTIIFRGWPFRESKTVDVEDELLTGSRPRAST